ncbi:type II toxin-antitoxin system VapC family toxin [Planomonospora alba]|uniref:Ribonuclease VapC n=1 Tax=Planomonospora alba TaxID=161354 RepID=A0ABP6NKE8_9ACTN
MIVIDSSAVVEALVGDPVNSDLLTVIAEEELHAPALLDFEVSGALRGLVLGKKLDERRLDEAVEDFGLLHIRRYQMTELLGHVLGLRENFTTYDAAYVVLAQALDASLVTSDTEMREAEKFGVDVRVLRPE